MSLIHRKLRENILPILLFSIFLGIGLSIYRDYGISWDEPLQRDLGIANLRRIFGFDQPLVSLENRFHGPLFQLFLVGAEKLLDLPTLQDVFFLRHLLTFLVFFVGTIFFYFLSRRIFNKPWMALLCTLSLILSPRIFDNAFYNPKDIPLLVAFIVSFTFLVFYIDTRRTVYLFLLAVCSAITTTIRNAGILIPFLTILVMALDLIGPLENLKKKLRGILPKLLVFLLLYVFFTVLFWPVLWANPIGNFVQALKEMSYFKYDNPVLFMGTFYYASQLPWYYAIVWILISTPIVYSLFFFVGVGWWIAGTRFSFTHFFEGERLKLLVIAAWFFAPLLLVILLNSVLYDSWRHLFFIYPAFLLLAFWGFEKALSRLAQRYGRWNLASGALLLVLCASFISTTIFMVRAHPYEQLYFNRLAGKNLSEIATRFDMDYWGLAYHSGLEYIARTDPSSTIYYAPETTPGTYTYLLPEEDAKRLVWLEIEDIDQATYFVTNYKWKKSYPGLNEVYSVQVEGVKILSVFKLK